MQTDRSWVKNVLYIFALQISAVALLACSRNESSTPIPEVTLRYVNKSASKIMFRLENRTTQTVAFRGVRGLISVRPLAGVTSQLECRKAETDRWWPEATIEEAGPETIKVAPGQDQQLDVDAIYSRQYKDGLCRLKLRLESGASIESNIFIP